MLTCSVHRLNEAFAKAFDLPLATVEAYSRDLRKKGALPQTKRGGAATPISTTKAGDMLAALLRGSPSAAGENAHEVGGLILHGVDGASFDPVVEALCESLGWAGDMTFSQGVGWLLDLLITGKRDTFVKPDSGIRVEVDRYWTQAWLKWTPTAEVSEKIVAGWAREMPSRSFPPRAIDGTLRDGFQIQFHSPLLYEAKISYRDHDTERNRIAHRRFQELKKQRTGDRNGSEYCTERTLQELSAAFKEKSGIANLREGNAE